MQYEPALAEEMDDDLKGRVFPRFMFYEPPGIFERLDQLLATQPGSYDDLFRTFRGGIRSICQVTSIPFTLTMSAALASRWQSILTAERIRALPAHGEPVVPAANREAKAREVAVKRMAAETNDPKVREYQARDVMARLNESLGDKDFAEAAAELLRQSVVMTWGAFESFVADFLIRLVNDRPELGAAILMRDPAKKHFSVRGIGVEEIVDKGFDLQRCMGDVILGDKRLDSLPFIRDLAAVLFPGMEDLHQQLNSTDLWRFWQRRHLIVHKRGVVDRSYIAKTGEKLSIGTRLELAGLDIEGYLAQVVGLVVKIREALLTLKPVQ